MVNAKGEAVVPKVSNGDAQVEMKSMLGAEEANTDIMQLARLGDIESIKQLFESGKFHPTYCDDEGITPLHVGSFLQCGYALTVSSGLLSTTSMPCANSSSMPAQM